MPFYFILYLPKKHYVQFRLDLEINVLLIISGSLQVLMFVCPTVSVIRFYEYCHPCLSCNLLLINDMNNIK